MQEEITAARQAIGEKLRQVRDFRGLTQAQLAERIGITAATVSKVEAGKWNHDIDLLAAFAKHLEAEIDIYPL